MMALCGCYAKFPTGWLIMPHAARQWAKRLLILVLVSANALVATASDRQYVGVWYGETDDAGQYGSIPFSKRRWIKIVAADGTAQTTYRYYLDSRMQTESVEWHHWGFDGRGMYWEQCISARDENGQRDCSGARPVNYSVQAFDGREFRYTSMASGKSYLMTSVPRDFTFPR